MTTRKLIVFGAGGFGSEAVWTAECMNDQARGGAVFDILGYVDDDPAKEGGEIYGRKVLGTSKQAATQFKGQEVWFYCALGSNDLREKSAQRLEQLGWKPATLIHPSVIRAKDSRIGDGTYVGANSILNPNTTIGRHVLINQRVAVGHDALMEDFSQACPGAQLNGNVRVGRGAVIGSNASIHPGRTVGEWATVGANSLVIKTVKAGQTVCGVPARVLMAKNERTT